MGTLHTPVGYAVAMDRRSNGPLPGETAREVVRTTADLAHIAEGVMHVMFPRSVLYRSGGEPVRLMLEPGPGHLDLQRLKDKLFELVGRPEWRRRHAMAREVADRHGTRLEVMTPVGAADYRGGARLVGPFSTEEAADSWGGDNAVSTLSFDTFYTGDVWLVDIFDLPEQDPHGIS